MPDKPIPIRAKSTVPKDNDLVWIQHAKDEQRNAPGRIEETAKYLAGVISISLTIFIDKRPLTLQAWTQIPLSIAAVLWMMAALGSFTVLFPWRYTYREDSPSDIRRAYRRIVKVKMILLAISTVLFLAALSCGIFAFIKGWEWPQNYPNEMK